MHSLHLNMHSLQSLNSLFRFNSSNLKSFLKNGRSASLKLRNGACYSTEGNETTGDGDTDHRDINHNYSQRIPRRFQKRLKYMKDPSLNEDGVQTADLKVQKMLSESRTAQEPLLDFPSDVEEYTRWKRDQTRPAFRPKVDPQETSVILFPGQGSQFVGMGEKLLVFPDVKEMYDHASSILRYDLLNLCINGPKIKLDRTVYCQPAVFVTSLAAMEKLKEEHPKALNRCIGTAGFSVGEYAALVFAGVMNFEEALQVVKVRAEAMQAAAEEIPSGMMTVFGRREAKLGLAMKAAKEFCRVKLGIDDPVCEVANYLFTDCKVIAGHQQALDFIKDNARDFGLARFKQLPVSGAFHTNLMESAKAPVMKELNKIEIQRPSVRVHSNVDGKGLSQKNLKKMLTKQIVKPVKWEQIMHTLYTRPQGDDFPHTYEVGPGRQLGTMLKVVNIKAYSNYHSVDV